MASEEIKDKAKRVLIYPSTPDYVREAHIKKLIEIKTKNQVEKVMINYDHPVVILGEE